VIGEIVKLCSQTSVPESADLILEIGVKFKRLRLRLYTLSAKGLQVSDSEAVGKEPISVGSAERTKIDCTALVRCVPRTLTQLPH
jgi:hypothetical protein